MIELRASIRSEDGISCDTSKACFAAFAISEAGVEVDEEPFCWFDMAVDYVHPTSAGNLSESKP